MPLGRARRVVSADDDDLHVGPAAFGGALFDDALALFSGELQDLAGVLGEEDRDCLGDSAGLADAPHVAVGDRL